MTDRETAPAGNEAPQPEVDPAIEALREILLSDHRRKIARLEAQLAELERQMNDEEALIATITPVIGDAIRRKIQSAREEMVEALYPIIGQVVLRAVSEAIEDLARTVDARVRTSFNPRRVWWRLRARLGGVSSPELALREALPFQVVETFLIHRETGLLLVHVSQDAEAVSDPDLIGSMLTAIRDFVQDAFGQDVEGEHLEEIEYGDRRILIEAAQRSYLAVVVEGIEPPGFRAEMRERLLEIERTFQDQLRRYDGDAGPFQAAEGTLRSLAGDMEEPAGGGLSRRQKGILAGVMGVGLVFLLSACVFTGWVWRTLRALPPPAPQVVITVPVPVPVPATLPAGGTPTPAPAQTPTPRVTGMVTGDVWVLAGPAADAPRLGMLLKRGQPVEILALSGNWYQVRWEPQPHSQVIGWVLSTWVQPQAALPTFVVTPQAGF